MKISYQLIVFSIIFVFISLNANGQVIENKSLSEARGYETVMVKGSALPLLSNVPVDQIYLYAFYQNEGQWKPIPFQIDELDPSYSDPPDQLFDDNDELLFLAQDVGDKVSSDSWIDNENAQSNARIEIEVVDNRDQTKKGWCYLFKSTTLTESDKSNISYLTYDATKDSLIGKYYQMGYRNNWFPQTIFITADGKGNGKDFYDRTKFRIRAIPLPGVDLFLNEDNLLLDSTLYLIEGPIRILRRINLNFDIPNFDYSATFTMKYFPYFSNFSGNVELQSQWQFKILRMSYDLNPDIAGAKFYSGDSSGIKNNNITIDGNSDASSINLTLQQNSPNWTMATGPFGSILTINSVEFEKDPSNTEPYTQSLYYWDNKTGAPLPIGMDQDTGDNLSYGDHGMIFDSYSLAGVVTYNSETYFLPANKTSDFAQNMFYNFNSPLFTRIRTQNFTSVEIDDPDHIPSQYRLRPNFPNPFNAATRITFDLPKDDLVILEIFDLQGRKIITLVNKELRAGIHSYFWDGRDQNHNLVTTGVYLCSARMGGYSATQKLAFIK